MQKTTRVNVTTTGSAGSATGTGDTDVVVNGQVTRVDVNYHASAPSTTDVTVAELNTQIPITLVNLANQNTDKQLFPTVQLTDNSGTGRTYDGTRPVVVPTPINDILRVTVGGCDALTNAVVVEITYESED